MNAEGLRGRCGVAVGAASITATLGTVTGATSLTVNPPLLQQVRVSPVSPAILFGGTQQLTATGTFTDDTTDDVTAQAAWTSSNQSVATITSPGGLATAVAPGATLIRATVNPPYGTFIGETNLVVAVTLTRIDIDNSPPGSSFLGCCIISFSATGVFSDSSTRSLTRDVIWTSSNPAVATIDEFGLARTRGEGSTTITAPCET